MPSIEVYHGSANVVSEPMCNVGRDSLDFGKGFYVTAAEEQAIRWAKKVAKIKNTAQGFVNVFSLDKDAFLREAKCKIFSAYDLEWLNFVVANRKGENAAAAYDYIEGGVANDRVINTIEMYMLGYYGVEQSLQLLAQHAPNNQICIRNQTLLNKYLRYERTIIA